MVSGEWGVESDIIKDDAEYTEETESTERYHLYLQLSTIVLRVLILALYFKIKDYLNLDYHYT